MNGRIEQPRLPPRCPDYVAVAWLCGCAPTAADLAIFDDDEEALPEIPPFRGQVGQG